MGARGKMQGLMAMVIGVAALIAPVYGGNVMYVAPGDAGSGSQSGVPGSGSAVSTEAMFTVSDHRLTIYLQTAANVANHGAPVLTGLKFDVAAANSNPGSVSTSIGKATVSGPKSSANVQAVIWQSQLANSSTFDVGAIALMSGAVDALLGSSLADLSTGNLLTQSMLRTTYVFDLNNLADDAMIKNVSFEYGTVVRHGELAVGGPAAAVSAPLPKASTSGVVLLGMLGIMTLFQRLWRKGRLAMG